MRHVLHGALHLFDAGKDLLKYTWVRKGVPLIDQARDARPQRLPLFVSEGSSAAKKARIRHNAYLYQGLKQFASNAEQGRHCIFIFGHSLAENDDHILTRIGRGRCPKLYVGLYGDPEPPANKVIADGPRRSPGCAARKGIRSRWRSTTPARPESGAPDTLAVATRSR
ncbi:DUF4917 family protein [Sphingomonas sp. MMS24-JH45]